MPFKQERNGLKKGLTIFLFAFFFWTSSLGMSTWTASRLDTLSENDVLLVTDESGHIVMEKNKTKKFIPASILKILTALAAFHHLGPTFRFKTPLCWDPYGNLMVKGQGDPLLISEAWEEIARAIAQRLTHVRTIVLDDSYIQRDIQVPGSGWSTNPYDAPLGALCANFNTVFFNRDESGNITSAEPQTPITPLARKRIAALNVLKGRYTFSHRHDDIVLYAGELLAHFIQKNGVTFDGKIVAGPAQCPENAQYVFQSRFTLEEAVQKMLEYSNNFLANQIVVAMGAHLYGPPGTLQKGVKSLSSYAEEVLGLGDIDLVEGSGISRKNRLSAEDMIAVLKAFAPHRHLLVQDGTFHYKTGTLTGLRTRAGYIDCPDGQLYSFVLAVKSVGQVEKVLAAIEAATLCRPTSHQTP